MVTNVIVTIVMVVVVVAVSRRVLRHDGLERMRRWWRWLRRPVDGPEAVPVLFNDVCSVYRKAALPLPDGSHHGPQGVAVAVGDDLLAPVEAVGPRLRAALYQSAKQASIAAPVELAFRVDRDPTLPAGRWTVKVWYGPDDVPAEPMVARADAPGELAPDTIAADRFGDDGQPLLAEDEPCVDDDLAHLATDWAPAGGDVGGEAELIVKLPDGGRVELTSRRTELRVGRAVGCDVRIGDRTVSREHGRLRRDASGMWWMTACPAATNPVYVDGQPAPVGQPRPVGDGSQVQLSNAVTLHITGPDIVEGT